MPIHEYHCEPCEHTFETLIRTGGDAARCPICDGDDVARQFSVPAASRTDGGRPSSLPISAPSLMGGCGAGGCGSGMCAPD